MAVGMLMMMPGVTQDQYEAVNKRMFGGEMTPDKAPDGLIMHSAGPAGDGWYIYDVWESKEHFGRFAEEQVQPAVREVMGDAAAGGAQPEFYEIANLVHGR
ncbi:MAG: hypothetical protein E6G67_10305 [Actinobacteria bacterium]|nr:MAG: hypothetical protein E6G67_10305 [Actinomycetota bacterium]